MTERSNEESTEKWYGDGLKFTCTQCGKCCSGTPGFVWVDDDEVRALADLLEMEIDAFRQRFVRQIGDRESLIEYPDGDCIFLHPDDRSCLVYDERPIQCRTWPFWDSNLQTPKDWQATCRVCPGAGSGRLYSFEQIEFTRKQKEL